MADDLEIHRKKLIREKELQLKKLKAEQAETKLQLKTALQELHGINDDSFNKKDLTKK
jgi:hypothetical protein